MQVPLTVAWTSEFLYWLVLAILSYYHPKTGNFGRRQCVNAGFIP